MSFLESIQHGLEKASQEAARITKIQHLHNVSNDLNFKASQEGQRLIAKTMELYSNGSLGQGELTAICQQIATYQQQINEVYEELQRLQKPDENAEQPPSPIAPPPTAYPPYPAPPTGYPAYAAPAPTSYPPYPTQQMNYPAQPMPQPGYPAYPGTSAAPGYPAYPASPSGEPPTKPGAEVQGEQPSPVASSEPPTQPGAPKRSKAPHHTSASAELPADATPASTSAPGSYEDGVLPPIYSPFASQPEPAGDAVQAEQEKPGKAHHSARKASTEENAEPAAQEKKVHKAPKEQA